MLTSSFRPNQILCASRAPAAEPHLTTEEWGLILKALSAYRHNAVYRKLYDKLVPRRANPEVVSLSLLSPAAGHAAEALD